MLFGGWINGDVDQLRRQRRQGEYGAICFWKIECQSFAMLQEIQIQAKIQIQIARNTNTSQAKFKCKKEKKQTQSD